MGNNMEIQPWEFWFYAWLIEVKGISTPETFEGLTEKEFQEYLREYRREYGS